MKKYRAEVYPPEMIHKLLSIVKGTDMYLPVLLLVMVGLRRGELIALKWQDIDFKNTLMYGVGFQNLGFVIRQEDGSPVRPDSMTRKWIRFLEKNDLPRIRLHDLRHSNATALIQAGVNPRVVQERLGHSDVNITLNTYTHVLPEMDMDAAEKLDSIMLRREFV